MYRSRIIPVLSIDQGKLVKTVRFKKPNYLGDPINAIKLFNDKYVDELVVLDITASKKGRAPNFEHVYEMASECFSPFGYGGGISTIEHARQLFQSGVEKVVLNTAFYTQPELITAIADAFGSQSVVISIDVKKNLFGKYKTVYSSSEKTSSLGLAEAAQKARDLGAGELIVQSVDHDGTFKGLDRGMIAQVNAAVSLPVIGMGGASSVQDVEETLKATGASAIAAGSIFVYRGQNVKSIMISYPTPPDLL